MISVDLDSTLNTLLYDWIAHINKMGETVISVNDIDQYDHPLLLKYLDYVNNPDLYDILDVLDGGYDFIAALQEFDEVQIVTVTPDHHMESKTRFVKKHFPSIKLIHVKDCKLEHTKDTILIDDNLDNIKKHVDSGNGLGFVFTNGEYKYNETYDYPTGGYDDAIEFVKGLYNG